MKKILTVILILLAVMLTACGAASNGTKTGSTTPSLSTQTELIIGTLKLEGTANAITKEQAATLLPLWQTMRELQSSDTAAQQEKDALVNQIKETMTSEQLKAITDMKLTMQDTMTVMQGQNINVNSTRSSNSSNSQSQSFGGGPSGGMPAGGPPGGGDPMSGMGGPMMGGSTSATSTQTTGGQNVQTQNANQTPPGLMEVLIKLLEQRAAS